VGHRQLGDQELDIVRIASPITKHAQVVVDPESIRYHLERAIYIATHGRPGPCWLDIPVDVQAARVDESSMKAYDSSPDPVRLAEAFGIPSMRIAAVDCRDLISAK
jgi:acetolactate synthase I/II/III large subunit